MGFYIGSVFIPYYGFFIVLGIIAASIVGIFQIRLFHKDVNDFIIIAAMVALGGMIGAKVLYLIVSWKEIDFSNITDITYLDNLMGGGFVFYGGLIGGFLFLLPCKKLIRQNIFSYVAICIPCIPIAHAFGRLGCHAVGCCYGIPYDGFFSVLYQESPFAPNQIPLFPVQAVETIGNFVITVVLLLYIDLYRKNYRYSVLLYLLLYALLRFILEYFRYDDARGYFGAFSTSQWISILLLFIVMISFFYQKKKEKGKDTASFS